MFAKVFQRMRTWVDGGCDVSDGESEGEANAVQVSNSDHPLWGGVQAGVLAPGEKKKRILSNPWEILWPQV